MTASISLAWVGSSMKDVGFAFVQLFSQSGQSSFRTKSSPFCENLLKNLQENMEKV